MKKSWTAPKTIFFLRALFLVSVLSLPFTGCSLFRQRPPVSADPESARQVYEIRQATEKYLDIERAQADGYFRASGYTPNMGYQFAHPKFFSGFDLRRPPILLYDEHNGKWDLMGVVFVVGTDKNPKSALPFRGAEYLKRPMACQYTDGATLPSEKEEACPKEHPLTHAPLGLWRPDLWIMSAWVWYPNPNGVFSLYNPLLQASVGP